MNTVVKFFHACRMTVGLQLLQDNQISNIWLRWTYAPL